MRIILIDIILLIKSLVYIYLVYIQFSIFSKFYIKFIIQIAGKYICVIERFSERAVQFFGLSIFFSLNELTAGNEI